MPKKRRRSWRGSQRPDRKRWEQVRVEVLARDDCTCQHCGYANDGYGLEVHHIKPIADCSDDEYFELSNLLTLCRDCHRKESTKELSDSVLTWGEFMLEYGGAANGISRE